MMVRSWINGDGNIREVVNCEQIKKIRERKSAGAISRSQPLSLFGDRLALNDISCYSVLGESIGWLFSERSTWRNHLADSHHAEVVGLSLQRDAGTPPSLQQRCGTMVCSEL